MYHVTHTSSCPLEKNPEKVIKWRVLRIAHAAEISFNLFSFEQDVLRSDLHCCVCPSLRTNVKLLEISVFFRILVESWLFTATGRATTMINHHEVSKVVGLLDEYKILAGL